MQYKIGQRVWVTVSRNRERLGTIKAVVDSMIKLKTGETVLDEKYADVHIDDHETSCFHTLNRLRPAEEIKPETQGGTKHDTGKIRIELIPPTAIEEMGKAFTFGASKYEDHNWSKGFNWDRLIGAALRHLLAFNRGEDKDPESGESHIAHALACLAMLSAHEVEGLGTDNRRKVCK